MSCDKPCERCGTPLYGVRPTRKYCIDCQCALDTERNTRNRTARRRRKRAAMRAELPSTAGKDSE